jgi:hypothetical protein
MGCAMHSMQLIVWQQVQEQPDSLAQHRRPAGSDMKQRYGRLGLMHSGERSRICRLWDVAGFWLSSTSHSLLLCLQPSMVIGLSHSDYCAAPCL